MVQNIRSNSIDLAKTAPLAELQRLRSYSRRKDDGTRESWDETCDRVLYSPHLGLKVLGKFTDEEMALLDRMLRKRKAFGSFRFLWVGGTEWITKPEHYPGGFNCSSFQVVDWETFGMLMELAMMGCGTGALVEPRFINQLPTIRNQLHVSIVGEIGTTPAFARREKTEINADGDRVEIIIGDSRKGWVDAYRGLLELSTDDRLNSNLEVIVDVSDVRHKGSPLKQFGGVANPVKLPELFPKVASILNGAIGRKLNSLEVCLIINEAASVVVAGSIRRCLPGNTLIHTNKGLIPIKDVQVGYEVQTREGMKPVVNKFDQGIQQVYKVTTNGSPVFATINHKVAVLTDAYGGFDWKMVGELKEGDRLLHTTEILPGVDLPLPSNPFTKRPQNSRNCQPIEIPLLNPEVAWLIGYTHGNGYVSLGRNKHNKPYGSLHLAFNRNYKFRDELIQKIQKGLSYFGVEARITEIKGENTTKALVSSIQLAEYFREFIKKPNSSIEIPSWILTASVESRSAYLAGLMDSDGAINNRPVMLVCSVYPDFLRQVSAVYSSLGIPTRLKMNRPAIGHWKPTYHLTLLGFKTEYNQLIAPHSAKGLVDLKSGFRGFNIPVEFMTPLGDAFCRSRGFNYKQCANFESWRQKGGELKECPITVKKIEYWEECETYDIEVQDEHSFFAQGILVHNSANIQLGASDDNLFATAKDNLWQQDEEGNWRVDPNRDAMRMANLTRVYHKKPTLHECVEAVRKQFYSGEGAIMWAGEAIARCNADLLNTSEKKESFLRAYNKSPEHGYHMIQWLLKDRTGKQPDPDEVKHRMTRYSGNPCMEALGIDFFCTLGSVHLNQLDPFDFEEQKQAFRASALHTAAMLQRGFVHPRQQKSREYDPQTLVSFTGAFTFFVKAFGVDWLRWWEQGRPDTATGLKFKAKEQEYLTLWRSTVEETVWEYCDRHGLKRPNRCTGIKPEGCYLATYIRTTDQGVLFVDEIEPGIANRETGFRDALEGFTSKGDRIVRGYNNGESKVVRVKLSNGRYLECTPNHPLSMNGGWISASDLRNGDRLDFELGTYKNTVEHPLVAVNVPDVEYMGGQHLNAVQKTSIARYRYPSAMLPDLAYLVGVYWANGCFCGGNSDRARRIRFISQHYSVVAKIQRLWNEIFGIEAIIHRCSDRDAYYFDFASVELGYWMESNGLMKTSKSDSLTRIPEAIRKSSVESLIAFFAGYADGDGCFYGDGFCIDSVSEEWMRHLQQVGEAIGLCFGISKNSVRTGSFGKRPIFKIHLSRVHSLEPSIELVNKHSVKAQSKPVKHSLKAGQSKYPFTVISVEELEGTQPTYDIEVENSHWYYQGAIKSHNSGSLLTGVGCNGFHPPKDWYYIRRMTFAKGDPIALAAIDFGYTVVPSQSDKDEAGRLLDDPFDPRCTEWLVEVPVEEEIIQRFPEAATIKPSSFSALAQFDWYMQVQRYYTTFNTSATLEFREHEIEPLAERIYQAIQNDEGYISSALLARFDNLQTFPRLPFEPISKTEYDRLYSEVLARRKSDDFMELLAKHDDVDLNLEPQDSACSDGYCAIKTDGVKVTPNDRKTLSEELEPIFQEIAVITGEDF